MKKYNFKKEIIPEKLILGDKLYKIKIVSKDYIIEDFDIYTNDNKIKKIKINKGKHPNCDPDTKIFCFPDEMTELVVTDELVAIVLNMFKVFNFNSCYYSPWDSFEYL